MSSLLAVSDGRGSERRLLVEEVVVVVAAMSSAEKVRVSEGEGSVGGVGVRAAAMEGVATMVSSGM